MGTPSAKVPSKQSSGDAGDSSTEPVVPTYEQLAEQIRELESQLAAVAARPTPQVLSGIEHARQIVRGGGNKYAVTAVLGREADLLVEYDRMVREDKIESPDPNEVAARVEARQEQAVRGQIAALLQTPKGKALVAELFGIRLLDDSADKVQRELEWLRRGHPMNA